MFYHETLSYMSGIKEFITNLFVCTKVIYQIWDKIYLFCCKNMSFVKILQKCLSHEISKFDKECRICNIAVDFLGKPTEVDLSDIWNIVFPQLSFNKWIFHLYIRLFLKLSYVCGSIHVQKAGLKMKWTRKIYMGGPNKC